MLALFGLAPFAADAAEVHVSALFGAVVQDTQGERLGQVRDLAVDVESGEVAYATVNFGSPSRDPVELRAVPLASLRPGLAEGRLILDRQAASGAGAQPRPDARLLRASTVLGMPIEHPTGSEYGVISDVVIELETGVVKRALVELTAGVNDVQREVPFGALRFPPGSRKALLTLAGDR